DVSFTGIPLRRRTGRPRTPFRGGTRGIRGGPRAGAAARSSSRDTAPAALPGGLSDGGPAAPRDLRGLAGCVPPDGSGRGGRPSAGRARAAASGRIPVRRRRGGEGVRGPRSAGAG